MKKLFAVLLFAFLLGGYALAKQPVDVIDEAATTAAPWKVGEIVAEHGNGKSGGYRRFLGVTTQGHYLVQEFYQEGDVKASDPYRLVYQKDVVNPVILGSSIDGALVGWYITGEKKFEATSENGLEQGPRIVWYPNGQKMAEIPYQDGKPHGQGVLWYENGQKQGEGLFQMGEQVGVWREWDERGNLIEEKDFGSAK